MATEHKVLVLDWEIQCNKRRRPDEVTPNIKMAETESRSSREKVLGERRLLECA